VITVCVPDPPAREALAPLHRIRVLVWDGAGEPPDGIGDTQFLLAPYMGGSPGAAQLAAMPRLRVIQLLSAGVERWLPLVPAGVTLCNGRGVHGGGTAELAVAGILALVRELPGFLAEQDAGRWSPRATDDLDGKRLLVLGAGDIGRRVANALAVFGTQPTFVARTARDGVHGIDELDRLLPDADIVLVAVPQTAETTGLVDAGFLAALPDRAIVANVARGSIVHTDALLAEVQAGRLRAYLDVTDPEPLPAGHPLWQAAGVIITPHVGGGTHGWERRGYRLVREQVERYLNGEPLHNVVGATY
jgi:phosphoglycerate dehydrogenase-like enzyme